MKCSWCGRDGASIHILMSKDYPGCEICYLVWYDQDPKTPEDLRRLSLAWKGFSLNEPERDQV